MTQRLIQCPIPHLPLPHLLWAAGLVGSLVVGLGGCATAPPPGPAPADTRPVSGLGNPGTVTTAPIAQQPRSPLDDPGSPLYRKVVYFDYDSAELRPQYLDLLRTHAGYLYQTPGTRVTLEGHTDERGTRDYNLALGEGRANAVQRFLTAEGVPADRLTTLSYGEERPADPGHNEQSWALNRRVELVY